VREAHRIAYGEYEGGTVDHELVLIRSDESMSLDDKDWYLEWAAKTSGGVRLAHTPGTHANLLKQGYVDDLATRLRWAFDGSGHFLDEAPASHRSHVSPEPHWQTRLVRWSTSLRAALDGWSTKLRSRRR